MLIIGSTAIKYYFPDFKREPKDLDIIWGEGDPPVTNNDFKVEILKNPILDERYKLTSNTHISKNDLTTLKASHLCWDINWDKHMFDLQFLLSKGCLINETLFWKLYDYWNVYHDKNTRSDLEMSKEEFFDNAINYDEHQHDYLHTLLNSTPIYTYVLKDGQEVELDEDKFNNLSFSEKLDFVREEVMVMAYERFRHLGYQRAYSRMLKKFIISHAPKFSLIFILQNYVELHKSKINFIKIIEDELNRSKDLK